MADTYAWVLEQEFVKVDRKKRTTEQWIFEQKPRFPTNIQERREIEERVRQRMWEEAMNNYEIEAEKWMRREEEFRREAAERERLKKARDLQEELRRFDARMRGAEKHRGVPEDRYRAHQAAREREDRERIRAERALVDAWQKYETQWASLAASSEPLHFTDIPWPVHLPSGPTKPDDITAKEISRFLLSPLHSQNQSRKDRIRNGQLRWHPDRFQRVMRRVREEDKGMVVDGVGIVARCLNDMMAREKSVHRVGVLYRAQRTF